MPLPAIRTAHHIADGEWVGNATCRAAHITPLPNPDITAWMREHAGCEPLRWLGEENCLAAFALLGWEHPEDELDHSEIRGLGPGRDMTAAPGDRLVSDGEGWFYPMPDDEYQTHQTWRTAGAISIPGRPK